MDFVFYKFSSTVLNGWISEVRTRAMRSLLRRSWPLQPTREISGGRQDLESNVKHAHQSRTRPAPLTDFIWPVMRPLPLTAGHPRREQTASARSGSNRALTTGRRNDPTLSY